MRVKQPVRVEERTEDSVFVKAKKRTYTQDEYSSKLTPDCVASAFFLFSLVAFDPRTQAFTSLLRQILLSLGPSSGLSSD